VEFGSRRCLPECRVWELITGEGDLRCGTIPIETLRKKGLHRRRGMESLLTSRMD
jgi:hypothetical protein